MTFNEANRRFWRFLSTPFRAIVNLSGKQVRSLVTVGFLLGMISLSFENWAITLYLDGVVKSERVPESEIRAYISFLTERMRNTSILQGLITATLGAVVINADRIRLKLGGAEAAIGRSEPPA